MLVRTVEECSLLPVDGHSVSAYRRGETNYSVKYFVTYSMFYILGVPSNVATVVGATSIGLTTSDCHHIHALINQTKAKYIPKT